MKEKIIKYIKDLQEHDLNALYELLINQDIHYYLQEKNFAYIALNDLEELINESKDLKQLSKKVGL